MRNSNVERLLLKLLGPAKTESLFTTLRFPSALADWEDGTVTRAELAQAMNMALFEDLLERSPNGRAYTTETIANGGSVYFDHGALRTVRWENNGALPPGEAAFTRILRPLGFRLNGRYPLDKLGMTGRAYAHEDAPDEIAQFFVSELHPERFSSEFQQAVTNVVHSSKDPLTPLAVSQLWELEREGSLAIDAAHKLLPVMPATARRVPIRRSRQHGMERSRSRAHGQSENGCVARCSPVFRGSLAATRKSTARSPDLPHLRACMASVGCSRLQRR